MCLDLIKEFRRPVVFAGQLVFQRENLFTRSLHHETAFSIQRRLQFRGVQVDHPADPRLGARSGRLSAPAPAPAREEPHVSRSI